MEPISFHCSERFYVKTFVGNLICVYHRLCYIATLDWPDRSTKTLPDGMRKPLLFSVECDGFSSLNALSRFHTGPN